MSAGRLLAAAAVALATGAPLLGVSLPLRRFGLAEGIAGTHVNHVVRDSRGFLWLATSDGLSRFDGESFRNFGVREGLPSADVSRVVEGADGTLWLATAAGLARMRPDAPPESPVERVGDGAPVAAVCRGRDGLWVVSLPGDVARLLDGNGRTVRTLPLRLRGGGASALAEVPEGLVAGTGSGLWLVAPDGTSRQRHVRSHLGGDEVHDLAVDRAGRLVVAHGFGLFVAASPGRLFGEDPAPELADVAGPLAEGERLRLPEREGEVRVLTTGETPDTPSFFEAVTSLPDGRLFAASRRAAVFLEPPRLTVLDLNRETEGASLSAIAEDPGGSLWLGTTVNGALRLLRSGFVTYGREDGLASTNLTSVFRDREGALFVTAALSVSRLEGGRLRTARPRLPPAVKDVGWGSRQVALFDRHGDFWFAAGDGLLRFPGPFERLDGALPRRVYSEDDGLPSRAPFRLFQDRHGGLWVSTFAARVLSRYDEAADRFRPLTAADGLPPSVITAFAEDADGDLWLGSYGDGVFVLRGGRVVRPGEGAPTQAVVSTIVRSREGRMLVGTTSRGLYLARREGATLRWDQISVRSGLASDRVLTVVEGRDGLVYVGTPKGVDRLDVASGRVGHMSYENGFPGDAVASLADGEGCLLFATRFGLGRFCPGDAGARPPAPALLTAVRLGGRAVPVSPFGSADLAAGRAGPAPLAVEAEFLGLSFVPGERLAYRYRIEGLSGEWSEPRTERIVRLASVPPGRYRLEVEATRAGEPAGPAATLSFEVVPPFYRRPWFFGAAIAAVAALALGLERARVRHLVAVERVRTRIATDLHDDLGSSLSRISILSEVALSQVDGASQPGRLLGEIGTTARELIDALSDSIWSVDPRKDDLQSLLDRVKRFARDVFEAQGVAWRLDGPADAAHVALSPLERRHLFLLLKEALHNVVKHARARTVSVEVTRRGRRLLVLVADDGVGLAGAAASPDGHGLASMRARAASLGGSLRLESPAEGGLRLVLDVPLASP